jgi:uncharacterized coiled-coil protein SlyX
MTDTPTPGSEWLLPVKAIEWLPDSGHLVTGTRDGDRIFVEREDIATLIPASRLADLEAEVARWQQLYEDARHDLTKAEMEVARLTDTLQMIEKFPDDSTSVEWANNALNPKD